MRDYLELDTTPIDEPCAQVGSEDYSKNARLECKALAAQLIRVFGEPPAGTSYTVRSNPHDFGTYLELAIRFDDEDEVGSNYAYEVEGNLPQVWDAEAKSFLASGGYSVKGELDSTDSRWASRMVRKEASRMSSYKLADFVEDLGDEDPSESEYIVSKTYEVVTQESAEEGDFADSGFVFQDEPMDRSDVVRELRREGYISPSASFLGGLRWVSTEPEQDYSDGSYTTYSLHIKDISGDEWKSLLVEAGLFRSMGITGGSKRSVYDDPDPIEEPYNYDTDPGPSYPGSNVQASVKKAYGDDDGFSDYNDYLDGDDLENLGQQESWEHSRAEMADDDHDEEVEEDSEIRVDTWFERDRASIVVYKGDTEIAEWWDDDVRQMFEDGFFNNRNLEKSVIDYCKSVGIIREPRRFDETSHYRSSSRLVYEDCGVPPNTSTATMDHNSELRALAAQIQSMSGTSFNPNSPLKD